MDENLIVIANENYTSALVLQSFLESNGIKCYLKNVNLVQPNVSDNVKVQISEGDAEKAIKLLAAFEQPTKSESNLRKILVPIDFTEHSKNAAYFALKLAYVYNAEVKLLHVFNSPVVDMIPFTDAASIQIDVDISYQILQKNAKEHLLKFYHELRKFADVNGMEKLRIGYSLREGFASYGIIDMCRRYKPAMLVMGTKSEGFRSSELVGSVATEVVNETGIPLLVIPEKANLKDISEVKNVLYATRFDDSDSISIRKLITILSGFQVNIFCASVTDDVENPIIKGKVSSMKDYFSKVSKKIPLECDLIKGKDKVEAFKGYIAGKSISLFALTMRKRSMLARLFDPSLTRKMLAEADIPLLIFPG
ncbi:MAG TPA: universal stress protein [Tenuifilaceae bacterium]|nr:universal stress protein [Tenuifilaceae bacterium]HPE19220.1 universal stress protein [Tenuifilaceae bacterium]HPJ46722.1 universal stress protein [Tenuifilaceae bacterium]HPQ33915.1 universal stress protein [Tenuifilaceae bacterium]HRX67871.1 universal stress protein [Tenuifilaceae bacterium]